MSVGSDRTSLVVIRRGGGWLCLCSLVSPESCRSRIGFCGRDGGSAKEKWPDLEVPDREAGCEPPLRRRSCLEWTGGSPRTATYAVHRLAVSQLAVDVYTRLHPTHLQVPNPLRTEAVFAPTTALPSRLEPFHLRVSAESLFVSLLPKFSPSCGSRTGEVYSPRTLVCSRGVTASDCSGHCKADLVYPDTVTLFINRPTSNVKPPHCNPNAPPRFSCVPRFARHVAQHGHAWIPTHSGSAQRSVGRTVASAADGSHRLVGPSCSVPLDPTRPARCRATVADNERRTGTPAAAVAVFRTPSECSPTKRRFVLVAADHHHHHFAAANHDSL